MVYREAHLPPLNIWQGLQDIQSNITDDKSMPKITKRTGRHSMPSELSTTSKVGVTATDKIHIADEIISDKKEECQWQQESIYHEDQS